MKKKIGVVDKKIPVMSGLVTKTVLNTKTSKVQDTSSLVTTTILNTKMEQYS